MQDLRGQTMGGHDKRSQVKNVALHHSGTDSGDVFKFENYWKSKGWQTGGYHEVVLRNGDFQLCYDGDVVTNGIYGHNQTTLHICYVGNGDPTDAQLKTLHDRIHKALDRFNLSIDDVLGHKEFSGASTACPGINMNHFRVDLKGALNRPSTNISVDGYWGSETTTALQKELDTVVDGVISNQLRNNVTEKIVSGIKFGSGGSLVIKALQGLIGANVDGYLGPNTITKLQQHLGTVVDGKLSEPSLVVETLQKALNKGEL
ncbi:peptidoglycan recognition protein family protein [Alkalibacillus salilacus]|uniref:Autolysin n=1 Tax=Alkalibacillus salilacus TaxID=284582 RepID=A0ABT9VCX8_9BACI|nr:peptidoglycan recognition family protein [Alkalibacillus salilacus]MDQ0158793.1 peptidoglycan hydrolase-like protein with peptidoglycan-binding domain [Alkalibacillus salilacus]